MKDDFWFRGGKILNPEPVFFEEKVRADVRVDCHDALICPGFIDVQVNGEYGVELVILLSSTRATDGLTAIGKDMVVSC